jgi:hypothetical protein
MSPGRGAQVALLLVAGLTTAGCKEHNGGARRPLSPSAHTATAEESAAAISRTRLPGALATVPSTPVVDWAGPGSEPFEVATRTSEEAAGHARMFGSITLRTALRARPLGQYPCTSCHFGRKVVMSKERIDDAHQSVQPVHPEQTGKLCSTCHAADSVALLVLENGERATLNESYRLCADCHFSQVDAWAHGTHGKRLDGWQGRRVVMACPDCHDPHRPAVQPRIPFRAPHVGPTRDHDQ